MAETNIPPDLPEDYYLTNVKVLLDFVSEHYSHLLDDNERSYHRTFLALSEDAQKLYVRMLLRKGHLFRQDKLSYTEISNIPEASLELEAAGYALIVGEKNVKQVVEQGGLENADCYDLLKLFTKSELQSRFKDMGLKGLSRDEIDNCLMELDIGSMLENIFLGGSPVILVCQKIYFFEVYKLLFFGNLYQDMTDFVLRDLGMYAYEQYPLDTENAAIQKREQLKQHLRYYELVQSGEVLDKGNIASIIEHIENLLLVHSSPNNEDALLSRRVGRQVTKWARQLERLRAFDYAISYYERAGSAEANERLLRIYFTQEMYQQGLELSENLLLASQDNDSSTESLVPNLAQSEQEMEFLASFIPRNLKKIAKQMDSALFANLCERAPLSHALKAQGRFKPPEECIAIPYHEESVEYLAALAICEEGDCYYVENTLINSVLGLAIWDIVFAPIRGAFFNPFQARPTDLSDGFYQNRKDLFETFWRDVNDNKKLAKKVKRNFSKKFGLLNPFVFWGSIDEELLDIALDRIPFEHWRAFFVRILADIRGNRSGLPDLIHFPHEGGYELIEVKGPGDKAQNNQLRWMRYFEENGIPYKLLNVEWSS